MCRGVTNCVVVKSGCMCMVTKDRCVLVCWGKGGKPTWTGWSRECVRDWWPFIKIAIPSESLQCDGVIWRILLVNTPAPPPPPPSTSPLPSYFIHHGLGFKMLP